MSQIWEEMVETLAPITQKKSVQNQQIKLISGGYVDLWSLDSASRDTIRGRPYKRVVLDEASRVPSLLDTWNKAVRPTLTDYRGDAWFLSTPLGLNGFYTLWQRGQDPLEPDWASWQFPTSSNPYLDPAEIEDAREGMPQDSFRQEYLAEFLSDGNGIFRRITEAATSSPLERGAERRYVYGVDWGKLNDFTVISVLDAQTRRQVALDRFNQIDYRVQLERLRALTSRFPPLGIVAELNAIGEPLVENLRAMQLPVYGFKTTNHSKKLAVEALSLAFERSTITILPDRVQLAELQAYEGRRTLTGEIRYQAPEGGHDDCVIALALSYLGCLNQPQQTKVIEWRYEN